MDRSEQITKDQHYVPVFYLKNFANEKNFVNVLKIKEGVTGRPKPYSGICYKQYYYSIKTGVLDEIGQNIERYFKKLEDKIAKELPLIYKKILNYDQINNNDRYLLAVFTSMLYLRGEYMRDQLNKIEENFLKKSLQLTAGHEKFEQHIKNLFHQNGDDITLEEIESYRKFLLYEEFDIKINDNSNHLEMLKEIEKIASFFYRKYWLIRLTKGSKKFFTSDTPVIEDFPDQKNFYGYNFFDRKHYFSLTPEILIEFLPPKSTYGLRRKSIYDTEVYKLNQLRANYSMNECYNGRHEEFDDLIKNYSNPLIELLNKSKT